VSVVRSPQRAATPPCSSAASHHLQKHPQRPHLQSTHPSLPPSAPPYPTINSSVAFNSISGNLPAEWARSPSLKVLKLNSNKIGGAFPKQWASLASLETLTIFDNPDLSGCLPAAFAGAGPSGKGFFQGPSGQLTQSGKEAAKGTKISGFC